MHQGLAALAEEASGGPPAVSAIRSLFTRVKSAGALFANREAMKVVIGKQTILARGCLNPRTFSKPESREVWLQRVRANYWQYRSLYTILFAVVLVYTVLSSPLLLLGLAMVAGAWAYAFVIKSPESPIEVFGVELRSRQKLMALAPFTLLVVVLTGMINSLIWVLVLTFVLALPHASFHEVPEMDALDALELEGLQSGVPTLP